jgi:hypothetical protein
MGMSRSAPRFFELSRAEGNLQVLGQRWHPLSNRGRQKIFGAPRIPDEESLAHLVMSTVRFRSQRVADQLYLSTSFDYSNGHINLLQAFTFTKLRFLQA